MAWPWNWLNDPFAAFCIVGLQSLVRSASQTHRLSTYPLTHYLLTHSPTIALAVNSLFTRRLSTNKPFTGSCLDATQSSAAGY